MCRALSGSKNKVTRFSIEPVQMRGGNASIKAHTCFNRLEVPLFRQRSQLVANIDTILEQDEFFFDIE